MPYNELRSIILTRMKNEIGELEEIGHRGMGGD